MNRHGVLADIQPRRNLFVPHSLCDELEDFDLTTRQRRMARAFVEPGLDIRPDRSFSAVDLPHDVYEVVRQGVLQYIGCRAGLERAVDVFIAVIRGQDDDFGFGMLPSDGGDRLETAHATELEIHQGHVWSKAI